MINLKRIRISHNLKQEDMARLIGVTLSAYCKKENGELRVSLIEANQIAKFFNMPIEEIFFAEEVSKKETKEI